MEKGEMKKGRRRWADWVEGMNERCGRGKEMERREKERGREKLRLDGGGVLWPHDKR